MSNDDQRKLVESIVTDGLYTEDQTAEISDRLGPKRVTVTVGAAFTVALGRAYAQPPTKDQIASYAKQLTENYRDHRNMVKPMVLEALIRAQLGEVELFDDLSLEDIIPHQMLVAYDIVSTLNLDEAGLNGFVDEALELVDEYERGL